ncbi:ParM/StbA family protein [candidate division KSB1 bacterium]|nr:ParM/StbA family protein [candidate division KSB1 bacterium]
MDVVGVDVGFGFTKATDGKEFILFKSVLGEATDIQFSLPIVKNESGPCMHVEMDGRAYFVGDFAEQHSDAREFTLDQEKLLTEFSKVLTMTAISNLSDSYANVNVVTGLPVGFYREYNQRLMKMLKGIHEIIFYNGDGPGESRRVNINNLKILPQPLGSFLNLLMSDSGKFTNRELAKQKIGIIDIGFRTTDCCIFQGMEYIQRGSSTSDTGISESFSAIAKKLREESNVDIELYRLYKAIETGLIKIRGKEYNISKLRDKVFEHSASIIANDVRRLWANDWDIDLIIISGGGAMELAKYLRPLIDGNVMPLESNVDARLNNVQGYLKYARYLWGDVEPPAAESEKK